MSLLSELQDRLRRNLQQIPGYAGGNLQDQLDHSQADNIVRQQRRPQMDYRPGIDDVSVLPSGKVEPRQNPMATRLRRDVPTAQQQLDDLSEPPPTPTYQDPVTGRPKEDVYRVDPDRLQGAQGLYNAYEKWKPHGYKRGFKNSLKAGAMAAAEAVRANPDDPVTAALAGFGVGAAGSAASPNFRGRLQRNMELHKAKGELGDQLKFAGEAAKVEQAGMVPVQLDDGRVVMDTVKHAGTLANLQQGVRQRGEGLEERKRVNQDRKRHWDSMDARDRKRLLASLYTSGGLNDPDLLEYAADQFGLPGRLREKFLAGQMRDAFDDEGNLTEVNRQTSVATPVVTGTEKAPVKGYQSTMEASRNRRAAVSQAGANRRAAANLAAKDTGPDRPTQRKAAELLGNIERAKQAIADADDELARSPNNRVVIQKRKEAVAAGAGWATQLNALNAGYEAGSGERGYPYSKRTDGGQQSRGRGGNDGAKFKAYANKFFGGDVDAARAAIQKQRGQ